jgi:hypothetical protein
VVCLFDNLKVKYHWQELSNILYTYLCIWRRLFLKYVLQFSCSTHFHASFSFPFVTSRDIRMFQIVYLPLFFKILIYVILSFSM